MVSTPITIRGGEILSHRAVPLALPDDPDIKYDHRFRKESVFRKFCLANVHAMASGDASHLVRIAAAVALERVTGDSDA